MDDSADCWKNIHVNDIYQKYYRPIWTVFIIADWVRDKKS